MVQPTRILSMDNMPLFPFILFFFVLKNTEITLIRCDTEKKCKAMVQIARVFPILHLAFITSYGTAVVAASTAFFHFFFSIHYHIKTSMKLSSLQFRIFQSNPLPLFSDFLLIIIIFDLKFLCIYTTTETRSWKRQL